MPKLDEIVLGKSQERVNCSSLPWLNKALGGGFALGSVYLLAGDPGIGKSTLSIQVLIDLAMQGLKVLYLTTERDVRDTKRVIERIAKDSKSDLPKAVRDNVFLDENLEDIDRLPTFFARRVLADGQDYHGSKVIIVDSVQGKGLAAGATKKYHALYEFTGLARTHGIVTILVSHITKKGQIAGPKTLEHNVDSVLYMRQAFRLRPFFVPKNRFGPAILDPVILEMDTRGRLEESPHKVAKSTAVLGYSGMGEDLAEGQASVGLPKWGSKPELNAPFLPSKKVRQILAILSTLKKVDLSDLSYEINCYIPRQQAYRAELDLPIAVALISSYLQQPIVERSLFVGELDLTRRIRPPERAYLATLAKVLCGPQRGSVKKVFISDEVAIPFAKMKPDKDGPLVGDILSVMPVADLPTLLKLLWPALVTDS